jgi:rod shape-determining protein MreD
LIFSVAALLPAFRAIPAILLTLLFTLFSMRSFELSSLVTLQVLLVLHALYYWIVFRPSLFPAWFAFLLGFSIDLIGGRLLGLNAFLLVFISFVMARQRKYLLSQPFATQWAGFLFVAFAAETIRWLVMCLVTFDVFSPIPALASALCNAAIYPLTSLVMLAAYKLISSSSTREI